MPPIHGGADAHHRVSVDAFRCGGPGGGTPGGGGVYVWVVEGYLSAWVMKGCLSGVAVAGWLNRLGWGWGWVCPGAECVHCLHGHMGACTGTGRGTCVHSCSSHPPPLCWMPHTRRSWSGSQSPGSCGWSEGEHDLVSPYTPPYPSPYPLTLPLLPPCCRSPRISPGRQRRSLNLFGATASPAPPTSFPLHFMPLPLGTTPACANPLRQRLYSQHAQDATDYAEGFRSKRSSEGGGLSPSASGCVPARGAQARGLTNHMCVP